MGVLLACSSHSPVLILTGPQGPGQPELQPAAPKGNQLNCYFLLRNIPTGRTIHPQLSFIFHLFVQSKKMHHSQWGWGWGGSQLYRGDWVGRAPAVLLQICHSAHLVVCFRVPQGPGRLGAMALGACWPHSPSVSSLLCSPTGCAGKQVSGSPLTPQASSNRSLSYLYRDFWNIFLCNLG